jgi:hypothetical protein
LLGAQSAAGLGGLIFNERPKVRQRISIATSGLLLDPDQCGAVAAVGA